MAEERFEKQALAHPDQIPVLRSAVVRHAEALGASPELADAIRLAVSEALTNAVMHAYLGTEAGPMTVEAWPDQKDQLVVRVLDDGHGLVPRADSPGLGIGFGLMAQMADDFRVANRDGRRGTIVSMHFSLTRPDPA